jgi:hypothetical protein
VRREAAISLFVLAGAWAATLWLTPFSDERVNDLFVYRLFAESFLDGAPPYSDAFLEYPPLAAPVIALPGLIGTGAELFRAAFAGWMLLLAAGCVLLCGALAARSGGSRRTAMLAMAVAPLLCGAMVRTHFDLAPVALTLAALLLLCDGRSRAGLATLGVAALVKGYPLLAAAPALAWVAAREGHRAALKAAAWLAAVLAVGCGLALAASPDGAVDALRYQSNRPVQIESAPATALLALDALGIGDARTVSSHRSDGLTHPADALVVGAFDGLLLLALVLVGRAAWKRPTSGSLMLAALVTAVAFAALGKVLSPQFLIWLTPLAALALAWGERALAAVSATAIVLTQVEFPARYADVVAREPGVVALVAVRNLALMVVLVLALRALSRPQAAAARSEWPGRSRRPRPARRSARGLPRRSRTSPG